MISNKPDIRHRELALRVEALLESKRLYLRPGLSLSDIAAELEEDPAIIADSIGLFLTSDFDLYLHELRIMHAGILFMADRNGARTGSTIENIGKQCGFGDHKIFTQACLQLTGMTPESVWEFAHSRKSLKGVFLRTPNYLRRSHWASP